MSIGQPLRSAGTLVLFGLVSLSASGLAGAHGAPEADTIPSGVVKASITSQPAITGLSTIILDAPRPGILLRYQGEQPLTVLGADGEAFLRFTRTRVEANTDSPSWQALPNVPQGLAAESGSWVTLSASGSYGWLDPRLNALHDNHSDAAKPVTWAIPIRQGAGPLEQIDGKLVFKTLQ